MKYIKGDLIRKAKDGEFDVIIHCCNCFHTMGTGIAKQIKETFPIAYIVDCKTIYGSKDKLGHYSLAKHIEDNKELLIINAYAQYKYGRLRKQLDYRALDSIFSKLSINIPKDKRIGSYKLGCNNAGGDWNIVKNIISRHMSEHDYTTVEFM